MAQKTRTAPPHVACPHGLVKNTNNISIFHLFHWIPWASHGMTRIFLSMQQCACAITVHIQLRIFFFFIIFDLALTVNLLLEASLIDGLGTMGLILRYRSNNPIIF